MTDEYYRQGHRVQTAIAALMGADPQSKLADPKHLRVGVDMSKSDQAGLVTLLIEKGLFTREEYIAALTKSATNEANAYERELQAVLSNRNVNTV